MPVFLEEHAADGAIRTYPLTEHGPNVVGRGSGCGVRILDKRVSRQQCIVQFRAGKWHLHDVRSTNGTFVNDRRVRQAELVEGDVISVGRVRLLFRETGAPGRAPTPVLARPIGHDEAAGEVESGRTAEVKIAPLDNREEATPARLLGGRYEIGELIHMGSTGAFYRARDLKSTRILCLKVLARKVAEDDAELRRFVRGVRTAALLQHPNIVQLYRAGRSKSQNQWWLAMEYVDGPSLRQVIAKYGIGNMLAPAKVLSIARDITAALEVAYEKQVLHRNIRPENILLTKSGTAKLSDFTLTRGVVLTTLQRITGSNELVGDLAYMAPERTDPDGMIDCRSDLYALGACLYTLLAGRPPFVGRGTVDLIERIRHDAPQPPGRFNLSVPGPLEGVVMKCLAKSPTDRFRSPMELREELARVAQFQGMWA